MDIKKFKFTYNNDKESFTPDEVAKLLSDQKQALNGFAVNEYKPMTEELSELKLASKRTGIQKLADQINAAKREQLIKYTSYEADASIEDIKAAMIATNEDLFSKKETPDTAPIQKAVVEEKKTVDKTIKPVESISAAEKWKNT